MPLLVVIGCQWGDEGKGKIVDLISAEADIVARYQGGNNAGHTVVIEDQTFILHLVPSGILNPKPICLIGNGVVVDPEILYEEITTLEGLGFEEEPRRLYPEGGLAANLLGFVASDEGGEDQGYSGLEGYYNGDLEGVPGDLAQEYSALGEPILMGDYNLYQPQNGSDLYLTIDRNIQSILERS